MGMINTKDLRRIDEATSNSSLSNLRYVITEKPKWKVFKKKEVVPLQPYRPAKGCPCGNDGPCKQKVTPKGVTIHYPQKKKKFGTFGSYRLPKVQKSYFSRLAWKALSSALPFQTRLNANINISLPLWPVNKVTNAYKAVKSMKTNLPSVRSKLKNFKSLHPKKKPAKRVNSADFMFLPFGMSSDKTPTVVNKMKMIKHRKFPTWRLDQIACGSPFCRNYGSCRCSILDKPKWKVRELVSNELMSPSSLGLRFKGPIVPVPPPPPSASPPTTVVNQESVSPLNIM